MRRRSLRRSSVPLLNKTVTSFVKSLVTLWSTLWLLQGVGCEDQSELDECSFGRCADGTCLGESSRYRQKCLEEECGALFRRCGNTVICARNDLMKQSCPGEPCTSHEYHCLDGTCILKHINTCPDGSAPCKKESKELCKNGKCFRMCTECPDDAPFKCGDLCFSLSKACAGFKGCFTDFDRSICPESNTLTLVICIPIAIFLAIIFLSVGWAFYRGYCAQQIDQASKQSMTQRRHEAHQLHPLHPIPPASTMSQMSQPSAQPMGTVQPMGLRFLQL